VIRYQGADANNGCRDRSGCAHQNVSDYISPLTQPNVDLQRTTQQVCRCAVTDGKAHGADRVAEGRGWLAVNEPTGKHISKTGHKSVPRADTYHKRHGKTDGRIPSNKSNARKKNY
jgi:hypothetical protein